MAYIGNQSSRIAYTNLNKFKGVVANLTELGEVTGASSGDMYKVEDSDHAHMYDGAHWVDMGPIVGPRGVKGTGITNVIRTSGDGDEGTVDTYTITYDDTSTSTFEVRNGTAGTIDHITKTDSAGATDTYTAYADAAETQPLGSFEVYNGVDGLSAYEVAEGNGFVGTEAEWLTSLEGQDGVDGKAITSVTFTSTTDASGLPAQSGGIDTYTINYSDTTTSTYDVYNGADTTNVGIIDDAVSTPDGTWSSEKITQELEEAGEVEEAPTDDKQYARKNAVWVEVDLITLSQTIGTSTVEVMSQKAVTDQLATKAPSSHTHPWSQVTEQPVTATRWPTFAEVSGKPTTFTPTTHTHTTSQITGLDTALAAKANTSTQVIAGTGLSGGGTLAADRTLNVSYGTTAGTATQGNDSRITGAFQKSQVVQSTGTSTTDVMSQKATTDAIANIPSVSKTSAYTVAAADKGASIDTTANVTIRASVFTVGDVIVVTNTSATDSSIIAASGVTIRLAGSTKTGTLTLAGYGVATLRMVSNNVWFASGAGLK